MLKCVVVGLIVLNLSLAGGATPEYTAAVELFRQAKRSDNRQRDYSASIAAFRQIAETTANPELQIRSDYFLALAAFLQRDFPSAIRDAQQVLTLGQRLYPTNSFARLAGNLSAKRESGTVELAEVRSVLTAQQAGESALLLEDLRRFAQTVDRTTAASGKVKPENLEATAIVLALYAAVLDVPRELVVDKVRQAECVSHLHELIAAWRQYSQEHGGKLVPVSVKIGDSGKSWEDYAAWPNLMQAYIDDPLLKNIQPLSPNIRLSPGTALSCPGLLGKEKGDVINSQLPHYGMNAAAVDKAGFGGYERLEEMPAPGQTVIFMDSKSWYVIAPTWGLNNIDYRHAAGVNCAFADGHVDWLSRAEIEDSAKKWQGRAPWQP